MYDDDDLETVATQNENVAEICEATPEEKKNAMSIMLKGAALALSTRTWMECEMYEDGMELLLTWYNSSDKQWRLLADRQGMCLIHAMYEKPDEGEITVFRAFVFKIMSLQHQFHPDYHTDRQLMDRLLNYIDLQHIKSSLCNRIHGMSQKLINRVAN